MKHFLFVIVVLFSLSAFSAGDRPGKWKNICSESWKTKTLGGGFSPAQFGMGSDGALGCGLRISSVAGSGKTFYGSYEKSTGIALSPSKYYTLKFSLGKDGETNSTNSAPVVRLRVFDSQFILSAEKSITPASDFGFYPKIQPTYYELAFQAPAELNPGTILNLAFDVFGNTGPTAHGVTLYDWDIVESDFFISELTRKFEFNSSSEGWIAEPISSGADRPILERRDGVLWAKAQGGSLSSGWWGISDPIGEVGSGDFYRVRFLVKSMASNVAQTPVFRLRINSQDFQYSQSVVVSSGKINTPTVPKALEYTAIFSPGLGASSSKIRLYFDLISTQNPAAEIGLDTVTIERVSKSSTYCKELVNGSNDARDASRFNFVFVGTGFQDGTHLKQSVSALVDKNGKNIGMGLPDGLLQLPAMKDNFEKINVWYVDRPGYHNPFPANKDQAFNVLQANYPMYNLASECQAILPNRIIPFFIYPEIAGKPTPYGSYLRDFTMVSDCFTGQNQTCNRNAAGKSNLMRSNIHEMLHGFGCFLDEYPDQSPAYDFGNQKSWNGYWDSKNLLYTNARALVWTDQRAEFKSCNNSGCKSRMENECRKLAPWKNFIGQPGVSCVCDEMWQTAPDGRVYCRPMENGLMRGVTAEWMNDGAQYVSAYHNSLLDKLLDKGPNRKRPWRAGISSGGLSSEYDCQVDPGIFGK